MEHLGILPVSLVKAYFDFLNLGEVSGHGHPFVVVIVGTGGGGNHGDVESSFKDIP